MPISTPPPLPPELRRNKKRNFGALFIIVAMAIAFIALAIYFYHHDPMQGGIKCTFKSLTGYDCPGCGSQRALHALVHGQIIEAWNYNPLAFIAFPTAALYIIVELWRERFARIHAIITHRYACAAILVAIIAYWILRNL